MPAQKLHYYDRNSGRFLQNSEVFVHPSTGEPFTNNASPRLMWNKGLKACGIRHRNSLTSWLQPIIAMWRFTRNNGITEGFHNKMEMISRRAYGFRNFENYRIRVMTHCGWDGIINRTR